MNILVLSGPIMFQGGVTLETGAQTVINIMGIRARRPVRAARERISTPPAWTVINLTGDHDRPSAHLLHQRRPRGSTRRDRHGLNVSGNEFEISGTNNDINMMTGQIMMLRRCPYFQLPLLRCARRKRYCHRHGDPPHTLMARL